MGYHSATRSHNQYYSRESYACIFCSYFSPALTGDKIYVDSTEASLFLFLLFFHPDWGVFMVKMEFQELWEEWKGVTDWLSNCAITFLCLERWSINSYGLFCCGAVLVPSPTSHSRLHTCAPVTRTNQVGSLHFIGNHNWRLSTDVVCLLRCMHSFVALYSKASCNIREGDHSIWVDHYFISLPCKVSRK